MRHRLPSFTSLVAAFGALLTALSLATASAQAPTFSKDFAKHPTGEYTLDKAHASVTWRIAHMGLSQYTARFDKMDGTLDYRAASPAASSVEFSIDVNSVNTGLAPFNTKLMAPEWFDGEKHGKITFKSNRFESVGGDKYKLTGNVTLRGVTKPMTWDVTFNGGLYNNFAQAHAVGFSVRGVVKRSEFGMKEYIPMIGDDVEVLMEVEFNHRPKAG
jgi:polyisoprenoid-binding protein YceI